MDWAGFEIDKLGGTESQKNILLSFFLPIFKICLFVLCFEVGTSMMNFFSENFNINCRCG